MSKFEVSSVEVENLRGYEYTRLKLSKLRVLVGENNEGKSSLLKMLDRLLAAEDEFWTGVRVLSDSDYSFWYPANESRHRARRLTLNLLVRDGRFGRRFGVKTGDEIALRFSVRSGDGSYRLNIGRPRKGEQHDPKAVELWRRVKKDLRIFLLPPVRDARSSEFTKKVTHEVRQSIKKKLSHKSQSGAPKEYRLAKEIVGKINKIVSLNTREIMGDSNSPLSAMIRASEVRVNLSPRDVSELIDGLLYVYISTGEHDELKVLPTETGNGLQSLIDIDLSINRIAKDAPSRQSILIVEEPEAFLHPSAQRQFMSYLRQALLPKVESAVITTHSPIIVDEAEYNEIVLVRSQKHFHPLAVDGTRAEINTSLMSVSSSELFFAKLAVLVEGDGDKALLGGLLKRIRAKSAASARLAGIVIQVTGGSKFYAPWLRLLESYSDGSRKPIEYVWIMDGDAACNSDGSRAVVRAIKDSGLSSPAECIQRLCSFGDLNWDNGSRAVSSAKDANESLRQIGGMLFSCDLEWALFNGASGRAIDAIKSAMRDCGIDSSGTIVDLARRLGSKIETGKAIVKPRKQPFVRAKIAAKLPLDSLPPEIFEAMRRILRHAAGGEPELQNMLKNLRVASS